MPTPRSINIPAARRRYRLATDDDSSTRLLVSRPNQHGAVSVQQERFPDPPTAMEACLHAMLRDFEHDFTPDFVRFGTAFNQWRDGRPGLRPQCAQLRAVAEEIGNRVMRLVEGYAQGYLDLQKAAAEAGTPLPEHELPDWIRSGIQSIREGSKGAWLTMRDLVALANH